MQEIQKLPNIDFGPPPSSFSWKIVSPMCTHLVAGIYCARVRRKTRPPAHQLTKSQTLSQKIWPRMADYVRANCKCNEESSTVSDEGTEHDRPFSNVQINLIPIKERSGRGAKNSQKRQDPPPYQSSFISFIYI